MCTPKLSLSPRGDLNGTRMNDQGIQCMAYSRLTGLHTLYII